MGVLVPFLGCVLGSSVVFFSLENKSIKKDYFMTGLSGGILLSASIWSLLVPSTKYSDGHVLGCLVGFILGYLLILIINKIFNKNNNIVNLALAIHNIPEGMCVGVFLASSLNNNSAVSLSSTLLLVIGIAIQNFPEGSLVSLSSNGKESSKYKSFLKGCLIGLVELIFTIITIIFVDYVFGVLSFCLCLAAGTMIYTVLNEIFNKSVNDYINIGFLIGFIMMMAMDVCLS